MARFLHIYRRYWPDEGGVEWQVRSFCEHAAGLGHDVNVLVSSRLPVTRHHHYEGVKIMRCATVGTVANTPVCPPMAGWIKRTKPDLVEFHHAYPFGMWALLCSGYAGPVVFHYHFDISRFGKLQSLIAPMLQRALDRADRIIASSADYAASSPVLAPWLDKCAFIPPGVEPAQFELTPHREHTVAQWRRPDRFQFLFVGRLTHYKGVPDLLTALQGVDADLTIVGRGPLEQSLRAQVAALGLEDRVTFIGRASHEDLICHYHAADAFVLPSVSRGEAFGIVQAEAMLCGKPVICSDLPGVREVGQDGVTSRVYPAGNVEALAAALAEFATNPDRCRQMGEAGRERAREQFDLTKLLDQRLGIYEELLGRKLRG